MTGQTSPEKPVPEKQVGRSRADASSEQHKQGGGPDHKPDPEAGKKTDLRCELKQRFLDALAAGASVRSSTEALGLKPDAPYRWREEDTDFALRWRHAEEAGTDLIEDEAYRRAVKGVEKPVYRGGEVVGHVADYELEMALLQAGLAQAEINKMEAQHPSVFVAGWRPFIGWVCGLALAWHFLGFDIANWLRIAFFPETPAPPALNGTETLVTVLLSMLGLGGLRTVEKLKGVGRDNWK